MRTALTPRKKGAVVGRIEANHSICRLRLRYGAAVRGSVQGIATERRGRTNSWRSLSQSLRKFYESLACGTIAAVSAILGHHQSLAADQALRVSTADPPFFHSAHSSDSRVATIGDLADGLFVSADRFAFVDLASSQWIIVSIPEGAVLSAGRRGDGPGEFRHPVLVGRLPDIGVIVWDEVHRRLTNVTLDGSVTPGSAVDDALLTHWRVRVVASYPDGRFVIRDTRRPPISHFGLQERRPGRYRDTVQYKSVASNQSPRVIAEVLGSEMYYERAGSRSATTGVIFGAQLLEAGVGQYLAIAQTDLGKAVVIDGNGATIAEMLLPPGPEVSEEQIGAERRRRHDLSNDRARSRAGLGFPGSTTPFEFRNLPASRVARPIDRIIGDLDGRLWMRTVRPGEDREHWQVWDIASAKVEFTVVLRRAEELLDAAGSLVLVSSKDAFDVDYLLVREIRQGWQ